MANFSPVRIARRAANACLLTHSTSAKTATKPATPVARLAAGRRANANWALDVRSDSVTPDVGVSVVVGSDLTLALAAASLAAAVSAADGVAGVAGGGLTAGGGVGLLGGAVGGGATVAAGAGAAFGAAGGGLAAAPAGFP